MNTSHIVCGFGISALACLSACSRSGPPEPPPITYGAHECAICSMIISDDRHAAAIVFREPSPESSAVFDDIGCLMEFEQEQAGRPVVARFVRHASGSRWLLADIAFYLQSSEIHSPMDFGIAAYESPAEANAAKNELGGEMLDFDRLRNRVQSGSLRTTRPEGVQP